jgi:hypothetical protein
MLFATISTSTHHTAADDVAYVHVQMPATPVPLAACRIDHECAECWPCPVGRSVAAINGAEYYTLFMSHLQLWHDIHFGHFSQAQCGYQWPRTFTFYYVGRRFARHAAVAKTV